MSGFLGGKVDHMTQKVKCATDFQNNDAPDKTEPFFLYLPLHNVHAPYQALDEWLDKYSVNSTCQNVKFIKQWLM